MNSTRTRRPRVPARAVLALVGVLVTAAGALLTYRATVPDPLAYQAQAELRAELHDAFAQAATREKPGRAAPLPNGALALIRIPRFGRTWERAILSDVTRDHLARGPGHYPTSQMPGEVGNFAVAGHAWGPHGWFTALPRLRAGDRIVVETRAAVYTYRATRKQIVWPSQTAVIAPVPGDWRAVPTRALVTLTTCYPVPTNEQRLIWHGVLVDTAPRT